MVICFFTKIFLKKPLLKRFVKIRTVGSGEHEKHFANAANCYHIAEKSACF